MRLFAAVMPPQEAVDELRRAVEAVRSGPAVGQDRAVGHDRLRWTGEAGWHFTLAFMGEVGEPVLPDLYARLARAAHRTDPFPLRIHGSGHFGERALWVGAAGGLDRMRMLAERADAAARRAGIPMDQHRRYTPTSPWPAATAAPTCTRTWRPSPALRARPGRSASSAWSAATSRPAGSPASSPATRSSRPGPWVLDPRYGNGGGPRYARRVDPKTRNRVMAGVLVLMFVVVAVAAAVGQ